MPNGFLDIVLTEVINLPYKDPEKRRQRDKEYWLKNKEKVHRWQKKWYQLHRKEHLERNKKFALKLKMEVFTKYSNGKPKCTCCGEKELVFLTMDHKDGRKKINHGSDMFGLKLLRWTKKNNFPDVLQVLCWNCNSAKGLYGRCPHETKS